MDKYKFADSVAADMATNHRFATLKADPTFLDFLMQLFEQLLPMLVGCFASPQDAAKAALEGTIRGRLVRSRMNRVIRDELDDAALAGELVTPLGNSVLKVVAAS